MCKVTSLVNKEYKYFDGEIDKNVYFYFLIKERKKSWPLTHFVFSHAL